eukprot:9185956-Pyramimonas_sp.AAC.1
MASEPCGLRPPRALRLCRDQCQAFFPCSSRERSRWLNHQHVICPRQVEGATHGATSAHQRQER